MKIKLKRLGRILLYLTMVIVFLLVLFIINGKYLAAGEIPLSGSLGPERVQANREIKVMAWNLAKCFMHRGGIDFVPASEVEQRIRAMARLIKQHDPDLLFLSEVVKECTMCPVDQVIMLARETGLNNWAFGENYNYGLPFLRVVGGNAILSKTEVTPLKNTDLHGRQPFWITRNNRRILLCSCQVENKEILLAAFHTDSFDLRNNYLQTRQILKLLNGRKAILAGDFNATPKDPTMQLIKSGNRFTGLIDGPPTFPAHKPTMRIDYIFVPRKWSLSGQQVINSQLSDHRPVVGTFRISW